MKTFLIVYAIIVFAASALNAVCAYYQQRVRACRVAVSVIYVLTLVGILFGMSVLEGKYEMKMLYSSIIAALALAMVCLGEFLGKRLAGKNGKED